VLLPAWCLLRRADSAAVIGVALAAAAGDGHRKIAGRLGRAAATVRGWLRRFAGRAEAVRVFFTVLLARIAPDPVMPAGAASAVAAAVSAIAGAAAAIAARWPGLGEVPVWTAASAASGGLLLAPGWPGGERNTSSRVTARGDGAGWCPGRFHRNRHLADRVLRRPPLAQTLQGAAKTMRRQPTTGRSLPSASMIISRMSRGGGRLAGRLALFRSEP
jgi:hypothetical protein